MWYIKRVLILFYFISILLKPTSLVHYERVHNSQLLNNLKSNYWLWLFLNTFFFLVPISPPTLDDKLTKRQIFECLTSCFWAVSNSLYKCYFFFLFFWVIISLGFEFVLKERRIWMRFVLILLHPLPLLPAFWLKKTTNLSIKVWRGNFRVILITIFIVFGSRWRSRGRNRRLRHCHLLGPGFTKSTQLTSGVWFRSLPVWLNSDLHGFKKWRHHRLIFPDAKTLALPSWKTRCLRLRRFWRWRMRRWTVGAFLSSICRPSTRIGALSLHWVLRLWPFWMQFRLFCYIFFLADGGKLNFQSW